MTTTVARATVDRPCSTTLAEESDLDTLAGIRGSMATTEHATMPYAITEIRKRQALRATPPPTMKELNAADARCLAVKKLIESVTKASAGRHELGRLHRGEHRRDSRRPA